MSNIVDHVLNRITMYRLMLYYAAGLLIAAFGLGLLKLGPFDPLWLAISTALVTAVCWATNRLFAALFRVPVNAESVYITALLIALIMPPAGMGDLMSFAGLAMASTVAIASKFLLAIGRKHVFNPVALGVFAAALLLDQPATWWAGGTPAMLPFTLAGGLLVGRKLQRFDMIGAYILANLAASLALSPPAMFGEAIKQSLLYSPLLFAGFAMLTDPLTSAHAKWPRIGYGALVGALSSPNIHFGGFYMTPEIALLVGNAFAYAAGPKHRFKFTLLRIEELASGCFEYAFKPDRALAFQPGQYLDWTLGASATDSRGNRRTFTIASAPGDEEVRLGVKFYDRPSAFKRALAAMAPGEAVYGGQLAGGFTLPNDPDEKLAFIAGGIGVTPFASMIADLLRRREKRSIILLYGNNRADEIAYSDLLARAERELGIRSIFAVAEATEPGSNLHPGFIDEALIQGEIPDFKERTFYLSGPRAMVLRFQRALKGLGVASARIKVDFFPGFA